MADINNLI